MRKDSILQDRKVCFLSGLEGDLELHHCFFSANRKVSDENGFWVWLTPDCHRGVKSPHHDRQIDLQLKRACQIMYERTGTREEFMKLIGKNYLDWE